MNRKRLLDVLFLVPPFLLLLSLVPPAFSAEGSGLGASPDSALSPSEPPPDPSATPPLGEPRPSLPGMDPQPEEGRKPAAKPPSTEVEGKAPADASASERQETEKARKSGNDATLRPEVGSPR